MTSGGFGDLTVFGPRKTEHDAIGRRVIEPSGAYAPADGLAIFARAPGSRRSRG